MSDDETLFGTSTEGGEYPDDAPKVGFVTPYADSEGYTTGHAGEGASRDRAQGEVKSGVASLRQRTTVMELSAFGQHGLTWKELAERNGWHHGQASGVLSVLHKEGRIACLAERRGGCSIYVMPQYVDERKTVEHRGTRASEDRAAVERIRELLTRYPRGEDYIYASVVREALEGR